MSTSTPSHLEIEVAGQADDWAAVVARLPELLGFLPRRGDRVAVVGCGTSFYMAQAYAALREAAGQGETDAFAASESRLDRRYDAVLAITRSGTTTEVVEVLRELADRPVTSIVIVATPGTPVTELADHVVLLSEVDEQSVVQTRFATSALALLRASLGEDLSAAIAAARAVLDEPEELALAGLGDAEQVTFVGRGWTVGLAEEAGLKLRESAQSWSESYPAMEYRHGPISIAAPGRVTWMFGTPPEGIAQDVAATGARFVSSELDPLADLVRAQKLSLLRARAKGLNADEPRNLTRSVILAS
jgi:fructoselysine-6-P-deglycase FrlB-like protein